MVPFSRLHPSVFYFILSLNIVISKYRDVLEYAYPNLDTPRMALFKNKENILTLFKMEQEKQPLMVDHVMKTFNSCFAGPNYPLPKGKRRPFIVIESNSIKHRQKVAKFLSETMGGKYLNSPPDCMFGLVSLFQKGSLAKNAYYALSLYATSYLAQQVIASGRAVVVSGYWHGPASFFIGKSYKSPSTLPHESNSIYSIPKDLMWPDLLVYLNYPYNKPSSDVTIPPWFLHKGKEIFRRFQGSIHPMMILDSSNNLDDITIEIHDKMRIMIGDKFDLSPQFPYYLDHTAPPPIFKEEEFLHFNNIKDVLNVFEREREFQPEAVEKTLKAYDSCFPTPDRNVSSKDRRPFIIVEGNLRRNKRLIAKVFAKNIDAVFLQVLPRCMQKYITVFAPGSRLKYAFLVLSFYVTAYNVRQLLAEGKAVVMNGFWSEHTAILLGKSFKTSDDLPEAGNKVYKAPEDLMMPDILFYLNSPIPPTANISETNKNHLLKSFTIYQRFQDMNKIFVTTKEAFYDTSQEMIEQMKKGLGNNVKI